MASGSRVLIPTTQLDQSAPYGKGIGVDHPQALALATSRVGEQPSTSHPSASFSLISASLPYKLL